MRWPVDFARSDVLCSQSPGFVRCDVHCFHHNATFDPVLRILEQSGSVRYVELLQNQRQKVPALKAAIGDLKAGRLQVREVTDTELVLHDGRQMRRDGARIDQGVCLTSHGSQCRTVDQVVMLPDGSDAKAWYVSLCGQRAKRN